MILFATLRPFVATFLDIYLGVKYLYLKMISLDGSGVHVWLVLWKAAQAVEAYATDSIVDLDMCGSDFAVLEALLHRGPQPVNEIGRRVLLTSGSITTAVDRLESRDLVERQPSADDRRVKIVHLTKEGRRLITHVFAEHAADMERLASELSAGERITLIRLLKKIGYKAQEKHGSNQGVGRPQSQRHSK